MDQYDLIIVGGGISGLTLACRAAFGNRLSILVLEKQERLGGCLHTWQVGHDFWVELGAHTAYNSYKNLLQLLQERQGLDRLARRAKLGYRYLDQGRLQSPLARLGWFELIANLPVGLLRAQKHASLAEYYGSLFGRRNYARLLSPAFAAVLSQPADGFPAQWLFRRKPRLKAAPRKYTWPTGLQGLAEALVEAAPFEVRTGMAVTAVRRKADGYEIDAGGQAMHCRYLALATPPDVAAHLLLDGHPRLAARLSAIPMAEIESLAVVVAAQKVRLPQIAGLIGVNDAFYSVVSRDYLTHPRLRGFTFHFRPHRLDREAKLARVCEVLGIAAEDISEQRETRNRLPALEVSHVSLMEEVNDLIKGRRLFLTGNYFQGMSIGDCADRSTREAYRLLKTLKKDAGAHPGVSDTPTTDGVTVMDA
jgi:protoporphyrinogen oxidase